MDSDTNARLERLEEKINATFTSVEKTRRYFLITMWVTLAMVVLPMIGLLFVIPAFIRTMSGDFGGLL